MKSHAVFERFEATRAYKPCAKEHVHAAARLGNPFPGRLGMAAFPEYSARAEEREFRWKERGRPPDYGGS